MALSPENIEEAKSKAIEFLESSLYVLSLLLNVDLEEIDENSTNPIDPSNTSTYNAYNDLLMQVKAYVKLTTAS